MPRRKDETREPPRQRSRNGCNRCRARKTRCDEARPLCGQCRARGYTDCPRGLILKWESDFVGRAFGRQGVWSKSGGAKSPAAGGASSPRPGGSGAALRALDDTTWLSYPRIQLYSFVNAVSRDFNRCDRVDCCGQQGPHQRSRSVASPASQSHAPPPPSASPQLQLLRRRRLRGAATVTPTTTTTTISSSSSTTTESSPASRVLITSPVGYYGVRPTLDAGDDCIPFGGATGGLPLGNWFDMRLGMSLSPFRTDRPADADLLSYYLTHLCPLTVPCAQDKSPFSSLIFPYAVSSPSSTILEALLCLAASHRAKENPAFQPLALQYSANAMRQLRLRLCAATSGGLDHGGGGDDDDDEDAHPEALVTMVLLCQSEITRSCDEHWVVHLRGARDLTRYRRRVLAAAVPSSAGGRRSTSRPRDQLVTFAERYFAFQDVMGRTACGEEPIFNSEFWAAQQDDDPDLWLGCSPNLVSVISAITEMSWKYHHHGPSPVFHGGGGEGGVDEEYEQELRQLRQRLDAIGIGRRRRGPQRMPSFPAVEDGSDGYDQDVVDEEITPFSPAPPTVCEDEDILHASAEAKRLAVEVYYHTALTAATPASPHVRSLVRRILRRVRALLAARVRAGLAWPLFVAAVQLDGDDELWSSRPEGEGEKEEEKVGKEEEEEEEHKAPRYARPFVLFALDRLAGSLANVRRVRSVVERVWREREVAAAGRNGRLGAQAEGEGAGGRTDWARFVAPFCQNVSLA